MYFSISIIEQCSKDADVTQEGYFVGSVAGVGRKAESPGQELQYFSPKYSTEIFSNLVFGNIIEKMKNIN